MAMSDCVKCWETPCVCGYEYRAYTWEKKRALASAVLGVSEETFDSFIDKMTDSEFEKYVEEMRERRKSLSS